MCMITGATISGSRSIWRLQCCWLRRNTPGGDTGFRRQLTVRAGAVKKTVM